MVFNETDRGPITPLHVRQFTYTLNKGVPAPHPERAKQALKERGWGAGQVAQRPSGTCIVFAEEITYFL